MANKLGRPMLGKRKLTQTELNRRHQDKVCSIDAELDDAFNHIDWERRRNAERSLVDWVQTYCVPLLLNDPPPELGKKVLEEMEHTITAHEKYMICMGRGSGKTSYVECATLFAIATGKQKYVVVISANQRASSNILKDIWRAVNEKDTPFSQDYPAITRPYHIANGSFRRRQLYKGVSTDLEKNASELVFPRLKDKDGNELPTSGSVISCRGVTSGIRGLKRGNLRPSYAILDDIMTAQDARSPEAIEKLMDAINKDIIPLSGKERLSILNTATPIAPDDLVEKIKQDSSWRTTIYPAIIKFPTNEKLWNEYFNMWDEENVSQTGHSESLNFYKEHRAEMDESAEVFNPSRYSDKDGHISAIQKLLELRHTLGDNVFMSEYQMSPEQLSFALPISPEIVASRKSNLKMLEIPSEDVNAVIASTDLNLSFALTTTITVFLRDQTSVVIYHKFRKSNVHVNVPEQEYYKQVYELLVAHGNELRSLGIRLDAWAIDCNGQPFNAVLDFCRNSQKLCGLPACGFIGRASTQFRAYPKSRLKEPLNDTVLCGDYDERKRSGSGRKYCVFNSDLYHEKVQKGFLQSIGNLGSISWYDGNDHAKWAIQVCGEKLMGKKARQDGTVEYTWREVGDHWDALDSLGQAFAAYGSMGFATNGRENANKIRHVQNQALRKRRFKIV